MTALLMSLGSAWAGPFEDGAAAYKRGDYASAVRIFEALATQGNSAAQYNLGFMYDSGKGVAQDYAEALKWYRLAVAQGVAEAQQRLGVMYADGRGVTQDDAEAIKWYRLAAAQGNALAQGNLGAASANATAAANRDIVAKLMTPQQIAEAKRMASDCQQRKYNGCD